MQIYAISTVLSDAGLAAPVLRALNPNHENYSVLLFQPQGEIEADAHGVRNADQELARKQYSAFLDGAATEQAALAITPEYSMPWFVLEESIRNGVVPAQGALWVIGCESLTLGQLDEFRRRVSDSATVLYETLTPQPARFLDPVAYVFYTHPAAGTPSPRLVVVVQFKTTPMGDDEHFEINNLQTGNRLYHFGDGFTQLRLATLICSDAFAFSDEHALTLYDRTLVIHIQLNPKPRQSQYRQYRARLMQFAGDQTELICLNWARDVHEKSGDSKKCWNNISGSAWYLRPDKYDHRDETLTNNHRNGLYYTWLTDSRCYALFFSYNPSLFLLTASKVAHIGVQASLSRRRGPTLTATRQWVDKTACWEHIPSVDDGFMSIVDQCGDAAADMGALASQNPFCAERALALCAGQISSYEWHGLKTLDSCTITASEVVRRITACQDTDVEAQQFRTRRLSAAHRVAAILKATTPAPLGDLKAGFRIDWCPESPHTNIVGTESKRRATAIYVGDEHTADSAYAVFAKAADHIGRWETTSDSILEAKQRLHVWYRDDKGRDVACEPYRYVEYDQTHTESPFDIGRSK